MIFIKVLTTIFLLLQGNTLPTLFGGFQNVDIGNYTEMSLYIDYEQLFTDDTLSYEIEYVDTNLNTTIVNNTYTYDIDVMAMVQQTSNTVLENLPLFVLALDFNNSKLYMPDFRITIYGDGVGYNQFQIDYVDKTSQQIFSNSYRGQYLSVQILDEYLLNYCDIFGGEYTTQIYQPNGYASFNYISTFEVDLNFTFANDAFFVYKVADYLNGYQSYASINEYKETIYNEGYNDGLNNDMTDSAIWNQGYNAGKTYGYNEGLKQGMLNCQTSTAPLANVFGIFESAATSLIGIFSIPLMPGITLGTLLGVFVGIPLLLLLLKHLGK